MEELANLPAEELETLRLNFLSHGDEGLNLEQFVKVILKTLGCNDEDQTGSDSSSDHRELVSSMCEMFEEIDRNGNGRVEWAELTSFWVAKGFVATRRFVEPLRFRYQEDMQYKDRFSRGSKINNLIFLKSIQRIASFEKESMKLKLYDPRLHLCNEIDVGQTIRKYRSSYRRKDELRNCLVVPRRNILVVLSSDLSITFWDAINLRFNHFAFSKSPQTCLTYSLNTGRVYTAGSSNRIQVWVPEKGVRIESITTRHKEAITDIVAIPGMLITCSLDKTIQMHDITTGRYRGSLVGHKLGIRHMVYSERQGTLLSAGMEPDVLGWDLGSHKQVVKLVGHRSSVIGIQILAANEPGKIDRAITADDMGNFRIWDFQRSHTGQAVCLQVFQRKIRNFHGKSKEKSSREGQKPFLPGQQRWTLDDFHPNTFCVTEPGADLIAATSKMFRFTSSGHKNMNNLPNGAIFNSVSLSFITITGHDVQVWDARTGRVGEDMFNLSSSELTKLVLDDRERKFIVGHATGQIHVHSYLNGVKMKQTEIAHEADVTDIAYVGREKLLISVARDRKLLIHDEWPEDESAPFLRGVSSAHHADVTCVSYSEPFSLIATGSADATVALWNFEFLKVETLLYGHSADIVALSFVGSYPILISADSKGVVLFSLIHPSSAKGRCLYRFENWNDIEKFGSGYYYDGRAESKCQRTAVTALCVHQQQATGNWILVLGDELGVVKQFDLSVLLKSYELKVRDPQTYPMHRTGYNARRRLRRDFGFVMDDQVRMQQNAARSEVAAVSSERAKLPLISAIKAHSGGINSIQIVDAPLCVLTSSQDRSVRIHDLGTGDLVGMLNMSDEDKEAVLKGEMTRAPWLFDVGPSIQRLEHLRTQKATVVLEQLHANQHAELSKNLAADTHEVRQKRLALARARMSISVNQAQALDEDAAIDAATANSNADIMVINFEPVKTHEEELREFKLQLLDQINTKDASAAPGVRATPSSYGNFAQENLRHKLNNKLLKKLDTEPSQFLRHQLGFGANTRLRERKQKKLDSLTQFKRKFATKGLLEDTLTMSSWLDPGLINNSEGEMTRRPNTAPEQLSSELPITDLWNRTNASYVQAIDNLLASALPTPRQLEPLENTAACFSPTKKRPSTAGANESLDRNWRRRSTAVLERFELATTSQPEGFNSSTEQSMLNSENPQSKRGTDTNGPQRLTLSSAGRRRRSLIDRQKDYSNVSTDESKSRRLSIKMKPQPRRSSVSPGVMAGVRFGPYHESHVRGFIEMFKELDPDHSGFIDMQEFYTNAELRESPIAASLGSIFETMDEDANATVDMVEFLACFLPMAQHSDILAMVKHFENLKAGEQKYVKQELQTSDLSEDALKEIDDLFEFLDVNHDGSIQLNELQHIAKKNKFIDKADLKHISQRYSTNENGELNKNDFIELCREYFSYNSDKLIREILSYNQHNKKKDGLRARLSILESTTLALGEQ